MTETEEYFPRGGKKPTVTYFKQSGNFLGSAEKGEKKKKKQKKKSEDDDGYLSDDITKDVDKSYKNCASRLSYKTIKPGVTILGRVRSAQETKLTVSLPGNMLGTVMACHISDAYNKQLEAYVNDQTEKIRELPDMFRPGQYVAVKVLEVEGSKVMLSMMPQHIYSGRTHVDLQKGDLLQAAVASEEDHGYVMDIGIPNTRPFLPKNKVNPDIELDAGVVTWCCIKSVTTDSGIVTLSCETEALQNAAPKRKPTYTLLPGTPVFFVVDKPLDNGIEGHIFDDITAYIQRQHADKVKGKKPALGQKIRARVLYVMPTRNTPFLTMKDMFATTQPNLEEEQKLKDGDIVEEAQVLRILGRSVHFKLGGGCTGTMSLKRIEVDEDLADEQVLAKSYPIGSTHRVRVISYSLSDYIYIVSDQPAVLAEKYFSLDQLEVGDIVQATIKSVDDNHMLVDVGRVTGYIPHTHYTDAGVFVDPKKATTSKLPKKFKPGQEIRARVLTVDRAKKGLILTAKPTLLDAGLEVLKSYEQAEVGKAYTGFIRVVKDYILVSFFANVTAFVPRHYVTKEPLESLSQAFHHGQIVTCTILKVDAENKKMTGSFTTVPFWPAPKREIVEKRKQHTDNEVPNKKQKQNDEQTEVKDKKKKKKQAEAEEVENKDTKKKKKRKEFETDDQEVDTESKPKKKAKKSKREQKNEDNSEDSDTKVKITKKKKKEEEMISSEESDAIETDIHEDSDQVLTPDDMLLIDLSECDDVHKCKRKIVSLTKNINARTKRIDRIDQKILKIEAKGLSAKNKMFHTSMHMEKLVVQERIAKLLEALKKAQEKLKELGYDEETDRKNKKDKKKKETEIKEDSETTEESPVKEKEKEKKEIKEKDKEDTKEAKKRKKDIKIVESLEPALEVPSAKDFWATDAENLAKGVQEDESSDSEEEDTEKPKKKRKKLTVAEKLAKAREEEERVREMERRAIDSEAQPRSSDQFERALLANPDCSQLWIAYMAFHLQATEIDKARAVGRRALSTISFREEQEKLNVWLALINTENRFGTKESQQKVLEEALQMNDTFKVHSKLLDIYVETSKQQELSSLVDLMMRKYKRDPTTYTLCGAACFKLGLVDKARQVMQKAISVLEKKEHVSVLVQFALLERSTGSRERAEALLEQVLAVYPQRVDVAAVYADMLLKGGEVDQVRQVMERMTSQKLPARKMKILYKKWIEVEEKIGDQDKVEEIRQRAMEYIEKAKF
ncbi:hypothetical protein ABMA28_007497 [Loxostege sticticalis]|uniref:rRNA biogenesis protein RRP5 n=1 Tax=Loxostege sticticalis TaxID=481309 RepID=A0ABD0SHR6_LOXSC